MFDFTTTKFTDSWKISLIWLGAGIIIGIVIINIYLRKDFK
jgi:uncharacterized membrane-anchored protein YhcB (DUF1043 family)